MSITKKAISVGLSAALLASLAATVVAPAAFASTAVTSVGTIPLGGTSSTAATFTFTENAAGSFPSGGGTLIVTLTDSAGGSTVHFTGTPTLTAPGSLGASITVDSSGNFFTINASASDTSNVEQITVGGLKISADTGAALGAINANLTGSLAGDVIAATTTATGVLQAPLPTGAATVLVNVTSTCGFDPTNADGQANFSDVSDARNVTSGTGTGLVNVGFAAGTSTHNIGTTVTQTVPNCSTALQSPGSVANVVFQGSSVTEQGNNPTTVNPGEQNQPAGTTTITENTAGYIPVGTLTFTLSAPGVQFSAPPSISSLTAQLAAPTGLTATPSSQGSLTAATYSYEVTALGVNAANTGVGETAASPVASATLSTNGSITLTWSAVAGATGYNVYRLSGTYKLLGSTTTATTFTDFGTATLGAAPVSGGAFLPPPSNLAASAQSTGGSLTAGTRYYAVAAINGSGQTVGSAPAFVTIASGSTNSVSISWNPVPGATQYALYEAPDATTLAAANGPSYHVQAGTSFTDTGAGWTTGGTILTTSTASLAAPTALLATANAASGTLAAGTYYYVVTATNGSGFTTASNTASAVLTSAGSVALSWTAVVGATSYNVYRSTSLTFGATTLLATGVTATSFPDTGAATVAGTPATTNGTGGNTTGAAVLGSSLCNLSYSRTSCSVSVTTASTIPSVITLSNITLDVASTVAPGTAVNVAVTSSPAINVNISTSTIAYVARVAVGVADQPIIYINYNQQNTGLITITEQAPGFFVGGTGSDNTFGLCLATGESFTFAPYAVVTKGDLSLLNGLVGGSSVQGTLYTDKAGDSCVMWTVYTASTVASTIEIRGTDSTGAVLPTGIDNGPSLSVPGNLAPGTTQGVILIGTNANVAQGIAWNGTQVDPADTPAFSSLVSMATRAYKSGVTVTALSQPVIPAGSPSAAAGNLQLTETLNGQFKAGETICVAVLPRTTNGFTHQDTFLTSATTNGLPIIKTNASTTGLLASSVATLGGCSTSEQQYFLNLFGVPLGQTNSFSFQITQQAYGAALGQITISNINYTTTADAPNGNVLVSVFSDSSVGVAFQSNVTNAIIGTVAPVFVSQVSAKGVTQTGPFSISTLVSKKGQYITIKITTSPAMAGAHIGIWVSKKGSNGVWSKFSPHTGRIANGQGVVYYYYKAGSVAWLSFQAHYPGDTLHSAALGNAVQARWIS